MTRKLTKTEEARFAAMAEWAESEVGALTDSAEYMTADAESGLEYMMKLLGSTAAVDRAMGRPNLNGTMTSGKSPVRHVRLPIELDSQLTLRAETEHRSPSELMREAITDYLSRAS